MPLDDDKMRQIDELEPAELARQLSIAQYQELKRKQEEWHSREQREVALHDAQMRSAEAQLELAQKQAESEDSRNKLREMERLNACTAFFLQEVPPFEDDALGAESWLRLAEEAKERYPEYADSCFSVLHQRLLGPKGKMAWTHARATEQRWEKFREYLLRYFNVTIHRERLRRSITTWERYETIAPTEWAATVTQDRLHLGEEWPVTGPSSRRWRKPCRPISW